jgi:hypothetical protein
MEARIAAASDERAAAERERGAAAEAATQARAEMEAHQAALDERVRSFEATQGDAAGAEAQLAEWRTQVEQQREGLETWRDELEAHRGELATLGAELERAHAAVEADRTQIAAERAELERMRTEAEEAAAEAQRRQEAAPVAAIDAGASVELEQLRADLEEQMRVVEAAAQAVARDRAQFEAERDAAHPAAVAPAGGAGGVDASRIREEAMHLLADAEAEKAAAMRQAKEMVEAAEARVATLRSEAEHLRAEVAASIDPDDSVSSRARAIIEAAKAEAERIMAEARDGRDRAQEEAAGMRADVDHTTTDPATRTGQDDPTPPVSDPAPDAESARPAVTDSDEEPAGARLPRRGDGESRYSRQSAKLPRIGESAGSVLSSMAGLRKGIHVDEDDDDE